MCCIIAILVLELNSCKNGAREVCNSVLHFLQWIGVHRIEKYSNGGIKKYFVESDFIEGI